MIRARMHADEVDVSLDLVRALLADQFPEIAARPLVEVAQWGTDHAVWRLGDELAVRLPRIGWASEHPVREANSLAALEGRLPVAVPSPVAVGEPGRGYPYRWAIVRWVHGEMASSEQARGFLDDLAAVIRVLRELPTHSAPPARSRARPLADYDAEARAAIAGAAALVDVSAATAVWEDALAAPPYQGAIGWVHGDLAGNCVIREGRLAGVIDWGGACVGDPAVDVAVIWSPLVPGSERARFVEAVGADEATVRRSRGAALQQACAALPYYQGTYPDIVRRARHQLEALGVGVLGPAPT